MFLIIQYKVRLGDLQSRTLNLSVWHAESLGRNVFLGEVEVSLGPWDWTYTQPVWQDLQPRVGRERSRMANSRQNTVLHVCALVWLCDRRLFKGTEYREERLLCLRELKGEEDML